MCSAQTEVVTDDEDGLQHYNGQSRGSSSGEHHQQKKKRGLRRLFGRLKRSSSQDFEGSRERGAGGSTSGELGDGEFRRGGIRATASARLAWSRDMKGRITNTEVPFARWDTDRVTAWMNDIGLNMYLVDCKRWVRNGEQLLRCSQADLEKELGMKNSLHRKKLQLAMQALVSDGMDRMLELDHNFVAQEFNEGKKSISGCPCPGRPKSCVNEQTIDSIKKGIDEDPHISVRELSDTNGLLYGTVHTIITEHLRMKKNMLSQVKSAINEKRPKVSTSRILLLHDNAGPHKARATTQSLRELGIRILSHPAYSPDLALYDFWLLTILKNRLAGKKFDRIQDLKKAVNSELRTLPEEDYQVVFRKRQIRPKRWLDDIGLPQYKDSFYDARVDGRMLNYLTVEDLFNLRVSNEVHHVSIKRGIQILRLNNFNPNCLRRRPAPDEPQHSTRAIPGEVVLWTNHRVMEWLRTIDMSEYAPNLRGSGVHGALMILEPRFNAELFAVLLSMPPSKTLLRRHLNTHFISLIGPETQTRKREHESQPGYIPLMPSNKLKKSKFALFSHKRTRSESEADGFICPLELNGQYSNGKRDEKAAKEIGAVSQEISSLTTLLSHERFFDSTKTSNV
ncbi:liprin-beta-1 [Elysia marginata]|uniref:Liprin-beta-1 n=1 Tax=Elysia marginata TaxID=1093978 RepID=A0AAV4FAS3_9GAST|nr:liprin-beta-1 [Elysia marginata]